MNCYFVAGSINNYFITSIFELRQMVQDQTSKESYGSRAKHFFGNGFAGTNF